MYGSRTPRVAKEIKATIGAWAIQPIAGWWYGSTARGDGDRGSDIDLLLVVPDNTNDATGAAQIGGLAGTIRDLTGNHAEIIEYTWKGQSSRTVGITVHRQPSRRRCRPFRIELGTTSMTRNTHTRPCTE